MINKFRQNFINWQFGKYVIVGLVGTAFDFSILYSLVEYAHLYYLVAATMSVMIVIWISFSLNKYWTFTDKKKDYFKQLAKYIVSHFIALAVSLAVLAFLVQIFHFWYIYAKLFATVAAAIVNFLIVKKYIFSHPEKKSVSEPLLRKK